MFPQSQARSVGRALTAPQFWRSWRYVGAKRDLRLDFIRGFALFAMIVNHIGGETSWLYVITGGNHFFFTAAEIFVFISGLVMGIIYASLIARQGIRAAIRKTVHRAGTLYVLTIGLSLALAALAMVIPMDWATYLTPTAWPDLLWGLLTARQAYMFTDVLLLYTFLVLAAGPILAGLKRGLTWPIVAASWALWAVWQAAPGALHIPWPIVDNGTFHLAAWQVLFVNGLVLGYHRRTLQAHLIRLNVTLVAMVSGLLFGASIGLFALYYSAPDLFDATFVTHFIDKPMVGMGRLVVFAIFMIFAYTVLTLAWRPIHRALGWLMMPLGQSSLTAFTLHLFVIPLLSVTLVAWMGPDRGPTENMLIQLTGIGLIWLGVQVWPHLKTLSAEPTTERRWAILRPAFLYARVLPVALLSFVIAQATACRGEECAVYSSAATDTVSATAIQATLPPPIERRVPLIVVDSAHAASPAPDVAAAGAQAALAAPAAPAVPVKSVEPAIGPDTPAPAAYIEQPPTASRVEARTFDSPTLAQTMNYLIYLPPGYDEQTDTRYPVLYMLHGAGDDNGPSYTEWSDLGLIDAADLLINEGALQPFLIVLPQGDLGYWMNHAGGGPQFGDYLAYDVVGEIDTQFRTLSDRTRRAVGGLSMGGDGALQLAFNYPEVFSIAGAHSPTLPRPGFAPSFYGDRAYYNQFDPITLAQSRPDIANTLTLWLDVGAQDPRLTNASTLHRLLVSLGVNHEWHTFPGEHHWNYWLAHVNDYALFYGQALAAPDF